MFGKQVKALVVKDLHVMRSSVKASLCEIIFPILMGSCCGLFIILITLVTQSSTGEFASTHFPNSTSDREMWLQGGWVGVSPDSSDTAHATYEALKGYNNKTSHITLFDNASTANHSYQNYADNVHKATPDIYLTMDYDESVKRTELSYYLHPPSSDMVMRDVVWPVVDALINAVYDGSEKVKGEMSFAKTVLLFNLRAVFSSSGAIFLVYAFIPSTILTAGRLVEEKRLRVRESLRVMGCSDTAYVVSAYISAGLRMGVGTLFTTLLIAAMNAIEPSSIPHVWGISLLFTLSLISFSLLMPALFSAPIWSNVCCILLLTGGASVSAISTGFDGEGQILTCLLSPAAFYYGVLPAISRNTVILHVGVGTAAIMLVIDMTLYLLLAQWLRAVYPGEFGVPKHPLFFLGVGKKKTVVSGERSPLIGNGAIGGAGGADDEHRVIIEKISKYYGNQHHTPSVDELSLRIRRGEILALLGHNGAGKTTTISMLTGMTTATSYETVTVNGYDLATEMDKIRISLGLCPQFDVLFPDLSAVHHLELFAEIKGQPPTRIPELMSALNLPLDNQRAATFSGGTKRRLSVANAIVGGSDLLFLDEPSSGMDPNSRREMWDLLKHEKQSGKTIVLTTHFMEEADYLGDRIAIMSKGKLFCCDTAQQLKYKFGVGYYLTVVKKSEKEFDVRAVSDLVTRHIEGTQKHHESSSDATFLLPIDKLPLFGKMLTELEQNLPAFGIHSYGISMNTLEDVFVAISEKEEAAAHPEQVGAAVNEYITSKTPSGVDVEELFQQAIHLKDSQRFFPQVKTVMWHKWLLLKRSRRMQMMILIFPIIMTLLGLLFIPPTNQGYTAHLGKGNKLPDYQNLQLLFVNLHDHDDTAAVRAKMQEIYAERRPGASLTFQLVDTMSDYVTGFYLPTHSVSYIAGFKSPTYPGGYTVHKSNVLDKNHSSANYTMLFNDEYEPTFLAELMTLYRISVESLAGHDGPGKALMNVSYGHLPKPVPKHHTPEPEMPSYKLQTNYLLNTCAIYFIIGVVQLASNLALPMADEMQRKVYDTMLMQGMTPLAYWAGNFAFDFMWVLLPVIELAIGITIKGIPSFQNSSMFVLVFYAILLCIHIILQSYVIVCAFPGLKPVMTTAVLHGCNLMMFGLPYIALEVMNAAKVPSSFIDAIRMWVLSATPPAAWYHTIDMASSMLKEDATASRLMSWDYGLLELLSLLFEMLVPLYIIYSFANNVGVFRKRYGNAVPKKKSTTGSDETSLQGMENKSFGRQRTLSAVVAEDEDVVRERERIERWEEPHPMVATKDLRMEFGNKVAVKSTSLGIMRGECFGLLGPNGAGKTTTCKLILQEMPPKAGHVLFPYSFADMKNRNDVYKNARLGVCQQHDTLWEFLDAREHMEVYLRLRLGPLYKPEDWREIITNALHKVSLADAGSKAAGGYSGGMKRKLIVSLAMYTGALAIFLDEPSSGMDPFARRALWKVISEALADNRCVLLTTHSMEEAEAVCGRIGIMTAGALRCIGSGQHLKNRFGSGYAVTITLKEREVAPEEEQRVDNEIVKLFGPETELKEVLGPQRRYGVPLMKSLAAAFTELEHRRTDLGVEQYGITQTSSLEQIFLSFVREAQPENLSVNANPVN